MRDNQNIFFSRGYANALVEAIIKGFSEKTFVCPYDFQQLYLHKDNLKLKLRKEGTGKNIKWFFTIRGGDNYGGEFETQVIEDKKVKCSMPRFEGAFQKVGFLKYEGKAERGNYLEQGYILTEDNKYIVFE